MPYKQPQSSHPHYDLVIVGGGLVGASLACALSGHGMQIALIEAHSFNVTDQPTFDDRAIALSYGSTQIYKNIGLWRDIADSATPIKHIHVSDQGHFGFTRIDHKQEGVDALGYVITAKQLGKCIHHFLKSSSDIHVIAPATVIGIEHNDSIATLQLDSHDSNAPVCATLVVGADGGNSSLRHLLNIQTQNFDYRQTAVTCNLTVDIPHNNVAYERFTKHGPIALLPIKRNQFSLVWTHNTIAAQHWLEVDDHEFISELQKRIGQRAGHILKVGMRNSYPLRLMAVKNPLKPRVLLIGNAAHTLHPIAGQGFNLGMRDVAVLAQIITDACATKQDIGSIECLNEYLKWRQQDYSTIINFTDHLVRIFSNRFPPLALARNLGMVMMDLAPPLKSVVAKHTMGMAGKLSRLARGLPL